MSCSLKIKSSFTNILKINPFFTCSGPVVRFLVWGAVDKPPQARDSVRSHKDVAAERSTVHDPDVERRMEEFIFWQILRKKNNYN